MQTFLKTYDIELLSVIMSHISWEVIELINDLYSWIDRLLNNFRAAWQAYIMDLQGHILLTVFEIVLCELMDSRSINELTFGGPALLLVDRRNMQ